MTLWRHFPDVIKTTGLMYPVIKGGVLWVDNRTFFTTDGLSTKYVILRCLRARVTWLAEQYRQLRLEVEEDYRRYMR